MTAPTPEAPDLPLDARAGLPEELRALLADFPREGWPGHPDFHGLVAFWLERHGEFRRLVALMQADAEALIGRGMDPAAYGGRLSRLGTTFVQHLVGHHQIEDAHYFPQLSALETRLDRGFAMLDRDHHDLDHWLHRFAGDANAVLAETADDARLREAAARFLGGLAGFGRVLDRHLTDEEDLIVPVILKHRVG